MCFFNLIYSLTLLRATKVDFLVSIIAIKNLNSRSFANQCFLPVLTEIL